MEKIKQFKKTLISLGVFIIYTLLVKNVDVAVIGPNNSSVGFSKLNLYMVGKLPYNNAWYVVSKLIGIFALLICVFFAFMGAYQLYVSKTLKKVDKRIYVLGATYVLTILAYIFFEKCIINYRPILEKGVLEASYPSSHAVLGIVVFGSGALFVGDYFRKYDWSKKLVLVAYVLMVLQVVSRLLSGVHWASDIMGGIILSFALVYFYVEVCAVVRKIKVVKETNNEE